MRILVLVVSMGALLAAQEPAQSPRFRVAVDAIQVDVSVTRRGRPVAGLTAADFELRDNGVVQRIESVTRQAVPLDLFLVLDASQSVAGAPLEHLTSAARAAVEALAGHDRVSLLTFTHQLTEAAALSSDRTAVLAAIDKIGASGATSLLDAVYAALVRRPMSNNRVLVIAFSDGHDTSSWLLPSSVLEVAKQTDAVVYAVSLARPGSRPAPAPLRSTLLSGATVESKVVEVDRGSTFLEDVSSLTGGRLLQTANAGRLRGLFGEAVREMKTRYVLAYTPHGVAREGWHTLDVRLTQRRGEISARRGYFVPAGQRPPDHDLPPAYELPPDYELPPKGGSY